MKEKIIEIIRNACALPEEINEDSELLTLSLDSLSFVGAVVETEEEFGIEFDIDELNFLDFPRVGDFIRITEKKINAKKQTR